jgi:hypothetical protein
LKPGHKTHCPFISAPPEDLLIGHYELLKMASSAASSELLFPPLAFSLSLQTTLFVVLFKIQSVLNRIFNFHLTFVNTMYFLVWFLCFSDTGV